MKCPFCGSTESVVTNSRRTPSGIYRRRECSKCERRFNTHESVEKGDRRNNQKIYSQK